MSDSPPEPPGLDLPAEAEIVARLRTGDEDTFAALLDAWSPGLLRAARAYVADGHTAEDVVQETWLAVLRGIGRFEARASLRTWTYRIMINIARTRGVRDARVVPMSSLATEDGPTVEPERFRGAGDPYPGHWHTPPGAWQTPESAADRAEIRRHIDLALDALPARQRMVIALRDVQGYPAADVCEILDISTANQRVLLHRARATVRATLAGYLEADRQVRR